MPQSVGMDTALVVLPEGDQMDLLQEAGELAAGVDATLFVLSLIDEDEVEKNIETLDTIAEIEEISYSIDAASTEPARNAARNAAETAFDDISVEYEPLGVVVESDKRATTILDVAEDRDCDHVFIAGRQRSPTGKAIFGDVAQSVILNFDGHVTVTTE
jgi:nucleotide-binding universal stress UspA family protein